jgi:RimJ/RimL family protein N-acetyltransferase
MLSINLRPSKLEDFDDLFVIVSNPDIMKWVNKGTPWSRDVLEERLRYSETDWKDPKQASWLHWTVEYDDKIVGYVYIHKLNVSYLHKKGLPSEFWAITRILASEYHGRGIGTEVGRLVLEQFYTIKGEQEKLYSLSRQQNISARKSIEKIGSKFVCKVCIKNEHFNLFCLN